MNLTLLFVNIFYSQNNITKSWEKNKKYITKKWNVYMKHKGRYLLVSKGSDVDKMQMRSN